MESRIGERPGETIEAACCAAALGDAGQGARTLPGAHCRGDPQAIGLRELRLFPAARGDRGVALRGEGGADAGVGGSGGGASGPIASTRGADPDTESSLDWLDRDYVRHFAEKAELWLDAAPEWPAGWTDPCGLRDGMVLVTAPQLADLRAELDGVLARYRRVGQGNPKAKRVAVYTSCQPLDLDSPPLTP